MYRKTIEALRKWKSNPHRKPLVVDGARQVGKTWLINRFGEEEYEGVAYVNLEKDPQASDIFNGSFDPERIIARLSLHLSMEIIPGKTLIFVDEAQQNPRALTALKYFKEDAPEYHIVVAGSLLGIAIHEGDSFPVGKTNNITINPLSFEEFLIALGKEQLARSLSQREYDLLRPFHDELIELYKTYCVVGGMPEVVQSYLDDKSMLHVREVQVDILQSYEHDFSKYADKFTTPKIVEIFNIIPSALAKENKKFMFGMIKESARAREYDAALLWLVRAGVATRVNRVAKVAQPLSAYLDYGAFKLFYADIGLLSCKSGLHPETIYNEESFEEFKGALAEQFVLQELRARGVEPFYYSADDSMSEIDFVVQNKAEIVPIEIKSGKNLRARSLDRLLDSHPSMRAVKISMLPYKENQQITNVPIYGAATIIND